MGVTLGITCFNAQDTIGRCIESALKAIDKDDEILIVDDCSTDDSIKVIVEYLGNMALSFVDDNPEYKGLIRITNDSQIRLLRHDVNKGVAAARNTLIKNSDREFIAFLDDDDVCKPGRLKAQNEKLLEFECIPNTSGVLVFGDREVKNKNGIASTIPGIGRSGSPLSGSKCIDFVLFGKKEDGYSYGRYGACTLFARVELLEELGDFDESFRRCAECDLLVRHCLNGGIATSVSFPVITQHITSGYLNEKGYSAEKKYYKKLVNYHRDYLIKNYSLRKYHYAKYRHLKRISGHFGRKIAGVYYTAMCCIFEPEMVLKKLSRSR